MPAITRRNAGVSAALAALLLSPVAISSAAADECSGIMCLFHQQQATPQPVPPSSVAAPPQAAAPAQEAAADPALADPAPTARAKPKARPVPIVTIAAAPDEAARLKALAGVMSRPHVRIVDIAAERGADFSVATSLDQNRARQTRLFPEAMHVLAGDKIHAFADLEGKNVSFGADGSAGQAVARKAFAAAGIRVSETPLDLDNALDGLATGDIAAVVVVAPQPDARLGKLASGLHLISWPPTAALPDGATAATLDAAAYPRLVASGEKIAALGVDAVLVATPKGRREPAAKAFLGALAQRSAALGKRGFGLLKADLDARKGRRVANNEQR